MRHVEDGAVLGLHAIELVEALLLEGGVAHRKDLVDDQHLGLDLDRDREPEPYAHARRVVLQLQVHELLELGERDDLVEASARLAPRQAEHDRVDQHVVASGQLGVEADAQLDERGQPPAHADLAGIDRVDAGEALEQRALAAAVAPHDAEELAALDLEAHVLEGRELVGRPRRERMQHALLQRRVALVREDEGLADPLGGDCRWRFRKQARPPIRAVGGGRAHARMDASNRRARASRVRASSASSSAMRLSSPASLSAAASSARSLSPRSRRRRLQLEPDLRQAGFEIAQQLRRIARRLWRRRDLAERSRHPLSRVLERGPGAGGLDRAAPQLAEQRVVAGEQVEPARDPGKVVPVGNDAVLAVANVLVVARHGPHDGGRAAVEGLERRGEHPLDA